MKTRLLTLLAPLTMVPLAMLAADVAKEVRHELVMLPYYGVFDNLAYRVDGSKVTLFGVVTRPTLKSDAENAVKKIEGVTAVDNPEIEVSLRCRQWTTTFDGMFIVPFTPGRDLNATSSARCHSIHIIVKNGNVSLEGFVGSEMDKDIAWHCGKWCRWGLRNGKE